MEIEAGRVLNERYKLIRPLGQGSQAAVWVADHLALTTHVAVKLIDPELAKREGARERFRREATAAAQLRSQHVVQIMDHGIDGDQPFIVMELLEGQDLFERLNDRTRLSLKETSKIVTQVARALSRAHQAGIVHRDLKPENVFLVMNEDDEIVKVLDFGVAKVSDPAKRTMQRTGVGTLIGTPHYMSPEQVKGIGEVDSRADLWALGVITYQCVTGELPFDSEGVGDLLIRISMGEIPVPSKLLGSLPPAFDAWFQKACARSADERFQTARELALALAGVAGIEIVKKPSMRPAAPAPTERASSPVIEEDDFEEIVELRHNETQPSLEELAEATSSKPKPPTKSRPDEAVSSPRISAPGSRPSAAIPLVAKANEGPTSDSRSPLMPIAPQSSPGRPPSTVDGMARSSRTVQTDPPPELDGSKRRRMTKWFVAVFVAAAAAIAFTVIRSQMGPLGAAPAAAPTAEGPRPVEPPTVSTAAHETPTPSASASAEAVDPGKVKHPLTRPVGTAKMPPRKFRPKKGDGYIEIPSPGTDDD